MSDSVRSYHTNRLLLYGPCHLCGGPQTDCWNVRSPDGTRESLTIELGRMCLACGAGNPSYHPGEAL